MDQGETPDGASRRRAEPTSRAGAPQRRPLNKGVFFVGAFLSLMAAALVVGPGVMKRGGVARCNADMRTALVAVYGEDAEPGAAGSSEQAADEQRLRALSERPSQHIGGCMDSLAAEPGFDAELRQRVADADQRWLAIHGGGD
jgi:hypothetical protein